MLDLIKVLLPLNSLRDCVWRDGKALEDGFLFSALIPRRDRGGRVCRFRHRGKSCAWTGKVASPGGLK